MAVAVAEKKKEWGAEMDYPSDEELPELPTRHETEVDVNGVKTVTTYRTDETGAKYKCMRTVKVTKKTTRVHKSVLERRKWAKFGQAELVELKNPGFHGPGFTNGFTQLDNADQQLEMTAKARVAEENNEAAARAFEKMNVGTFEAWRPKNRSDVAGDAAEWAAAQGITGGDKFGGGGGGGGLVTAAAAIHAAAAAAAAAACLRRSLAALGRRLAGAFVLADSLALAGSRPFGVVGKFLLTVSSDAKAATVDRRGLQRAKRVRRHLRPTRAHGAHPRMRRVQRLAGARAFTCSGKMPRSISPSSYLLEPGEAVTRHAGGGCGQGSFLILSDRLTRCHMSRRSSRPARSQCTRLYRNRSCLSGIGR